MASKRSISFIAGSILESAAEIRASRWAPPDGSASPAQPHPGQCSASSTALGAATAEPFLTKDCNRGQQLQRVVCDKIRRWSNLFTSHAVLRGVNSIGFHLDEIPIAVRLRTKVRGAAEVQGAEAQGETQQRKPDMNVECKVLSRPRRLGELEIHKCRYTNDTAYSVCVFYPTSFCAK